MTNESEYVLPNGFTYFASTATSPGSWAKALDPVTAARNAADYNGYGSGPVFVQVWYAPAHRAEIDNLNGGLAYRSEDASQIVPVGLFKLTRTTIKPSTDKRMTNLEWVTDSQEMFDKNHQHWLKECQKEALAKKCS